MKQKCYISPLQIHLTLYPQDQSIRFLFLVNKHKFVSLATESICNEAAIQIKHNLTDAFKSFILPQVSLTFHIGVTTLMISAFISLQS